MTLKEFLDMIAPVLPYATLVIDNDGEIVLYTDMKAVYELNADGEFAYNIIPFGSN
jgi:hypothetical protein